MIKRIIVAVVFMFSVGSLTAQSTLGHVNSQALMDTMPSRKAAIVKLQEFETAGVTELQEMEADFNASLAIYEKKAADMTPMLKQIEENKLMKKQQDLQQREQSLQQEMQAYSQELNTPLLTMVQDAVKEVAAKNKMDYVLDVNVTLYAGGIDITKQVIAVLLRMDPLTNP